MRLDPVPVLAASHRPAHSTSIPDPTHVVWGHFCLGEDGCKAKTPPHSPQAVVLLHLCVCGPQPLLGEE